MPVAIGRVPSQAQPDPALTDTPRRTGRALPGRCSAGAGAHRGFYQVNLAWPLDLPAVDDPIGAWLALRKANPAREGALLRHPDAWVLSNSPERYLHLERTGQGLQLSSAPIKGTVPRDGGKAALELLRSSPKERAELTMIVDLVRNDLGRIAAPGTVRAEARTLRACGDLWHAEQVVRATARPGLDAWDVVAASFPPGSVTGAPKVAAMKVIAELEGRPRGLYTGAIVALGDNGEGWLSVVIRTATISGGRAQVFVGAGIVADSKPEAEWRETLAKARALAKAVGRTP
ncbi:MAG: anthranilate synthase component I family protein [Oligoflexia bacterium]|nr:anthranilate synthase component I family protein [Oligoflexia bacterium]